MKTIKSQSKNIGVAKCLILFWSFTETISIDCDSPYDTEVSIPGITIVSPNYPSNYDNYQDCNITLRFAQGQKISLQFLAFEIEPQSDCLFDYLNIYDGPNSSSSLIGSKLCGQTIPDSVKSTGNTMHIHFHTDFSVTRSGFKILAEISKSNYIQL